MLPSLAEFPAYEVRKSLKPEILEECANYYRVIIQQLLRLPLFEFKLHITKDVSFINFIISLMRESSAPRDASIQSTGAILRVRAESFHFTRRILKDIKPVPPRLLEAKFLEDLAMSYPKSKSCKNLLEFLWDKENLNENPAILERKRYLIQKLDVPNQEKGFRLEILLERTGRLLTECYKYGQFLMLGSDFLDSLVTAFQYSIPPIQEKIVAILYWTLKSLLGPPEPKISTLLDHLYTLKHNPRSEFLLRQLIIHTHILDEMQEQLFHTQNERMESLIQELRVYIPNAQASKKPERSKGKSRDLQGHPRSDVNGRKLSLVAQVQDVFPEHSAGDVVALLDQYQDNVEEVISYISSTFDDVPPNQSRVKDTATTFPSSPPLSQKLPILPLRHNIHDNDAFDRLAIPSTSISTGRSKSSLTADAMLAAPRTSAVKEQILAALATFDMDNDERDDTYDVEDVGGTVDSIQPPFASDDDDDDDDEKDDNGANTKNEQQPDGEAQGIGRGRGRGRGRGDWRGRGRGRGASVSGPSNDRATQVARQRKDKEKASIANHSRRDQRARKMARAGGMVG